MSDIKTVWGASQYYTYTYINPEGDSVTKGKVVRHKITGEASNKLDALANLEGRKASKTKSLHSMASRKGWQGLVIEWQDIKYEQYQRMFI